MHNPLTAAIAIVLFVTASSFSAAPYGSGSGVTGFLNAWLKGSSHEAVTGAISYHALSDTSGMYVAHVAPKGFAVVSRLKNEFSVVGFSFDNDLDESKSNPVGKGLFSAAGDSEREPAFAKKTADEVAPLTTALFDQGNGWNALCPPDDSAANKKTFIGCSATAAAIVMHYWKYPFHGWGSSAYTLPKYGAVSAEFDKARYAWEKMSPTVPDGNNTLLLYHIALAMKMNFSPTISTSTNLEDITFALKRHFGYGTSMVELYKNHYTESEWTNMLKQQLREGKPVLYSGFTPVAGHEFVVDGYNSAGYFHINWGWGGNGNGYFQLKNLVYETYDLSRGQKAIFSVEPPKILPPVNLTGNRQGKTVDLSWNPPAEDAMLVHFELPAATDRFMSCDGPQRLTVFSAADFGFAGPVSITAMGHSFGELDGDSLFSFIVYDKDGATQRFKSSELKADLSSEIIHRLAVPLEVNDSFGIAVVPKTDSGYPCTNLALSRTARYWSMSGRPGEWMFYYYGDQTLGELHTYAYIRGTRAPGKFPKGGFLVERNGTIIDTLYSLENCTYRDTSVPPAACRYRVFAFRDTAVSKSLPMDSIVLSTGIGYSGPAASYKNHFQVKGNKCVVQTGSDMPLSLEVFSIAGKRICVLFKGVCKAGSHYFALSRNIRTHGRYFVRFRSGNTVIIGSCIIP